MSLYVYNTFAKGVENNVSGTKHTFWKTSFNMPVASLWDNTSGWVQNSGPFNYYGSGSSFDLSGFQPGWEVIGGFTGFGISGPDSGSIGVSQQWLDPDGDIVFTNGPVTLNYNVASGWQEYMLGSNQGFASWEINQNATYSLRAHITGNYNTDYVFNYTITNAPSIPSSYNSGRIWVEGSDLRWTSANGHLHIVYGTQGSYIGTSSKGAFWVDSSTNQIKWIGNDGYIYTSKYNFQQFASTFSNSATGSVNAGTSKKGAIWMDNQFGREHIGYIGNDGYKWIFPSGANPYANPPASSNP